MQKYSVLISVYKNEKAEFFIQSIDSMLSQTAMPEQIVLVKDGPLYRELDDVIETYQAKQPELFTVISLEKNVGLGSALDIGMDACRNELVARMDSDDISVPSRCEKQLARFRDNPQLDIVGTYISEFEDDPAHIRAIREVPVDHREIVSFARRRLPFNHPSVMYKKSAVIRCGGYGQARRKEDLHLFLSMLNSGCIAENIPESLLYYRANTDNLQRRKSWINCRESIQAFYQNFRQGHSSFADLAVVVSAQMLFFLLPASGAQFFSDTFLRKKLKNR